jgi:hypothetical protein
MASRTSRGLNLKRILFALAAVALTASEPVSAQSGQPLAVVELFTSQGCSSCPPADAYLGELAARGDVLALTLPVDYWDYLGWKDTFASHEFSERQREYALARGDGQVYTPQVVVNGTAHAVGSVPSDVEAQIDATKAALDGSLAAVTSRRESDKLIVDIGAAREGAIVRAATVWLAQITTAADVAIARGENGGRKITYHNVVRKLIPVGEWKGEPLTVSLSIPEMQAAEGDGCALLLQAGKGGPIIGATPIEILGPSG